MFIDPKHKDGMPKTGQRQPEPRPIASLFFGKMPLIEPVPLKIADMKKSPVAGIRRIAIEQEDFATEGEIRDYAHKYSDLIAVIAEKFVAAHGTAPEEKRFITGIWEIIDTTVKISAKRDKIINGFLSTALDGGRWDCDNTSFLVFDVAKKLGIRAELITAPNHVLVRTENFAFETTNGAYFENPEEYVRKTYGAIYGTGADEMADACAYLSCGRLYASRSKHSKAVEKYDFALELDRNDADIRMNRGNALMQLEGKGPEAALAEYDIAIQIHPEHGTAYYNRGTTYLKMEKYEEAVGDFRRAVELEPENAHARHNLAVAYVHLGAYLNALWHEFKARKVLWQSGRGAAYGQENE
jgi:tetratricopeptide (TPR) repeat protein